MRHPVNWWQMGSIVLAIAIVFPLLGACYGDPASAVERFAADFARGALSAAVGMAIYVLWNRRLGRRA
jgi:hypothetical protein